MFSNSDRDHFGRYGIDIKIPILHILNLFDGIITLYFLRWGVEELNPIMSYAYEVSPHAFLVTKVVVVSACLGFLDKKLSGKRRWVISALLGIYTLVICWHVCGMLMLWDGWYHGLSTAPPPTP